MFKDNRYINAGQNEFYRYGHKAVDMVKACMEPNESGYYSIAVDAGKYWTIGTSNGKYGEFCKMNDTIFSVNKGGFAYAKAGTEKGDKLVEALHSMVNAMNEKNMSRFDIVEDED